jgi:sulfatase maturation enzyme AslB (radical SAM superfamily)
VSVDAATQETFSIFRPSAIPNSLAKVTANIELLAERKQGLLGYSFLLMERPANRGDVITNIHEVFDAARLSRELGCDYFEFKPMVDDEHNLIPLSAIARESLANQIEQMKSLCSSSFGVIAPRSIDHLLHGTSEDQPKTYTTCPTLEMRTLVTPKGIYPCPYKRGHENVRIGNIDLPFDEYWKSARRRELSASINPSRDCPFYCIRHDMNLFLHSLAKRYDDGEDLVPFMIGTDVGDIFT